MRGPTTPARAWPEVMPKVPMATAMASSKLLPEARFRSCSPVDRALMLGGSPLAWLNNHGRPDPISATLGQTCAGAEGGQVRGQRGEFSGRGRFGRIGRVKGRPRLGGVRGASAQGERSGP